MLKNKQHLTVLYSYTFKSKGMNKEKEKKEMEKKLNKKLKQFWVYGK